MIAFSQDRQDRNTLVSQYAYLCRRGARKFLRPGLDKADLEQVAALGLIKAGDRYDPALRTPFEAFAWLFVVGELMHHVRDHERIVRAPRRMRQLAKSFQRAHDELVLELGSEPSSEQLRERLGVERAEFDELHRYQEQAVPQSIHALPAVELASQSYTLEQHNDRILVDAALSTLTRIERTIVLAIHVNGYTQIELSERLGYSRRHISRLHRAALRKLHGCAVLKDPRAGTGYSGCDSNGD